MKKLLSILFICIAFVSCKEEAPRTDYTIKGEAKGLYNGVRVYLNTLSKVGRQMPVDTAMIMNETFVFDGAVDNPKLYYVTVNGVRGRLPIMVENSEISLKLDINDLSKSEISGSASNSLMTEYQTKMQDLNKKMRNASIQKSDSLDPVKLRAKMQNYPYEFIEKNSNSFVTLQIFDSELRRRPSQPEKIISLFENLDDAIKSSEEGQAVAEKVEVLKQRLEAEKATALGAVAPEFKAPDPDGNLIALSDVVKKGKITIIDFWAAWCGPCRRENPNVVKAYEKYHAKGLEIIGVGLDGRPRQQGPKEAWIKAIEDDNLTWHQVSNLQYFGPIAKMYNVNSIPSMFVLNNKGEIIAKNLRGPALENKLAELLSE